MSPPKYGGTQEKCSRCAKTVYATERIAACKTQWHKACFKCKDCETLLTLNTYKDVDSEIYCAGCYKHKLQDHTHDRKQIENDMKEGK